VQSESSRVGWPEHPATGNGWSTGQPVTGSGIATIAIPIVFRTWGGRANDPTELRRRFGRCLFGFAIPLLVLAMCYLAAIVCMAAIMML
jgi:hypothetical protein